MHSHTLSDCLLCVSMLGSGNAEMSKTNRVPTIRMYVLLKQTAVSKWETHRAHA